MPFLKDFNKPSLAPWKEADIKANKEGLRHTVYSVNGDEYTGEWKNNKKDGRGTYKWKGSGAIYEGDWRNGKRNGFGVLSVPHKNEMKKQYTGGWKNDKRHGYGENWYSENEHYEGEWYADKRSGWGRMYYEDGSIYEGEWYDDQRNGQGMLRLPNDNRYEGSWKDDKKNGRGKYFYLLTGQVNIGIWVNDIAKCGEMIDFNREEAPQPTKYPIRPIELANSNAVIKEAERMFLSEME